MKRIFTIFLVMQFWAVPALSAVLECINSIDVDVVEISSSGHGAHHSHARRSGEASHHHGSVAAGEPGHGQTLVDEECCTTDLAAVDGIKTSRVELLVSADTHDYYIPSSKPAWRIAIPLHVDVDYRKIFLRTLRLRI